MTWDDYKKPRKMPPEWRIRLGEKLMPLWPLLPLILYFLVFVVWPFFDGEEPLTREEEYQQHIYEESWGD
jgi:hypothetical protein